MTFANIQNLSVQQGPLQRLFGIADLRVRTAGGGEREGGANERGETTNMHLGYFRGVSNAGEIRDLTTVDEDAGERGVEPQFHDHDAVQRRRREHDDRVRYARRPLDEGRASGSSADSAVGRAALRVVVAVAKPRRTVAR